MSKRKSRVIDSDDEENSGTQASETQALPNPSRRQDRNGRLDEQVDEEDDSLSDEEIIDEPHPRKRSRRDPHGSSVKKGKRPASTHPTGRVTEGDEDEPEETDAEEEFDGDVFTRRDTDGFLPGSIVRLSAKNFMTYDDVEFRFGAHLNMIIGPNGTGKSTLMCALALGLGYPPSVLARAHELKSFVNKDSQALDGSIEIELKGKPQKKNTVIKLNFTASSNARAFEIDGNKATLVQVHAVVRSFNIQVDNLCCFLPQEKVQLFSAMNPVQLLRSTEKAAGHPSLTKWHDDLIENGHSRMSSQATLDKVQDEKEKLDKRLQSIKKEVEILAERESREIKIKLLDLAIRRCHYTDAKAEAERAIEDSAALEAQVDELRAANEPMALQIDAVKQVISSRSRCRKALDEAISKLDTSIGQRRKACQSALTARDELLDKLSALKHEERRRKERINNCRRELEELDAQILVPVQAPDLTQSRAAISEISAKCRAMKAEVEANSMLIRGLYEDVKRNMENQANIRGHLENLHNVSMRKEMALKNDNHTAKLYDAILVLRRLQQEGRFQGEVLEPIRLVISAKQPRYALAIEGCVGFNVFNTFLCTNEDDYNLFSRECNDVQKLRVNIALLAPGDSLANYQPSIPREELRQFGFESYIIDLIDGPEAALTFLCAHSRLHQIPFVFSAGSVNEARLEDRACPIKTWIIEETRYNVSYSQYGKQEARVSSTGLGPARILTTATDQPAIDLKTEELRLAEQEAVNKNAELDQLRMLDKKLRVNHAEILAEKESLEKARQAAQAEYLEYMKRSKQRDSFSGKLEALLAQPSAEETKVQILKEVRKACTTQMGRATQYREACCEKSRLTSKRMVHDVEVFQLQNDLENISKEHRKRSAELRERQDELKNAKDEIGVLKRKARQIHDQMREATNPLPAEQRVILAQLVKEKRPDGELLNEDDYKAMVEAEQDALQLTTPVSEEVRVTYKELIRKDQNLQTDITELEDAIKALDAKISRTYAKWKPRLDEVIQQVETRFDATFKDMGCLGQVKIEEDPDFAKWRIEILLSFRTDAPLTPFTEHAQSGGERSLATIMYLLSLTDITKTPFCAVDEINQGLDMRAERLVHNRVVASTCKEASSQYFLITPKLLFGLEYHPLMRVLCINNGHWLPNEFKVGEFLKNARSKIGNRSST